MKNSFLDQPITEHDLAIDIAEVILEARIVRGLTQSKLASLMGTKQESIARAENGSHKPSLSFLEKMAQALGTYLIPPRFAAIEEEKVKLRFLSTKTSTTGNKTTILNSKFNTIEAQFKTSITGKSKQAENIIVSNWR